MNGNRISKKNRSEIEFRIAELDAQIDAMMADQKNYAATFGSAAWYHDTDELLAKRNALKWVLGDDWAESTKSYRTRRAGYIVPAVAPAA